MSGPGEHPFAALSPEGYAQAVEDAPFGFCVVQDGRVAYANRWVREFDRSSGGSLPGDALTMIHPEDRPGVSEQLRRCLDGVDGPHGAPARIMDGDGGERTVELFARRVEHRGRPAVRVWLVDESARVDAERRSRENAARLEESNRDRQLFGDILSHDLLNPVWVAENFLRAGIDEGTEERRSSLLEGARGALERARAILLDARTYLRIQDPHTAAAERVEAAPFVEAAAKSLRPLWERKGQRVEFRIPAGLHFAGSPLLREVLWNLLSNAVKYSPPGSAIEVVVSDGSRVRFEVRDRGPGVPVQDRERIFQRFERIEKGAITGVGLGLAIARRVAELHRGRVWVEDNPGGGSVFVAEFPAAPPQPGGADGPPPGPVTR